MGMRYDWKRACPAVRNAPPGEPAPTPSVRATLIGYSTPRPPHSRASISRNWSYSGVSFLIASTMPGPQMVLRTSAIASAVAMSASLGTHPVALQDLVGALLQ